jgi:hypothetical protein
VNLEGSSYICQPLAEFGRIFCQSANLPSPQIIMTTALIGRGQCPRIAVCIAFAQLLFLTFALSKSFPVIAVINTV